jgi:hypothetical protein
MLTPPVDGESFTINDGNGTELRFEFDDDNDTLDSSVAIPILETFSDLQFLQEAIDLMKGGQTLTAEANASVLNLLKVYGLERYDFPTVISLEELLQGFMIDELDNQRLKILELVRLNSSGDPLSSGKLKIKSEIIGFNGVFFTHLAPSSVQKSSPPTIISDTSSIAIEGYDLESNASFMFKGFGEGILRYPSRDSKNYHFTQLWSPPSSGVFTIMAVGLDESENRVMGTPITVTSTTGVRPPVIKLTSPKSGIQRSVSVVGRVAEANAVHVFDFISGIGHIHGVRLLNRGAGYISKPKVKFYGTGSGATAEAFIIKDPASPRFGQIDYIQITNSGTGYAPPTIVEFEGGLGEEPVFMNAIAEDSDGEVDQVEFLVNGRLITEDLTAPYGLQDKFPVGYYEFVAIARDDAGNLTTSDPAKLNVSTVRGAAPSGFIIYPLPQIAQSLYDAQLPVEDPNYVNYFWGFVEDYYRLMALDQQGRNQDGNANNAEEFSLTANSYIHLTTRATDADGKIKKVTFFLNNKILGEAKRQHDSHHYVLPVDLSDFGEQPVYRIDTMFEDYAENVVVARYPIQLDVKPASGSRPNIEIVAPVTNNSYAMGAIVSVALDVTPFEGIINRASMFANGRFIGEAEVQDDFNFGKKRYGLSWLTENPGTYNLTASVEDSFGTIIFTKVPSVVEILDSTGSRVPTVSLVFPEENSTTPLLLTSTSNVRLEANASDPDGSLQYVQFYLDGQKLGTPIYRPPGANPVNYPYGYTWSPGKPGQFSLHAEAYDTSGNRVMSNPVTVTSTTGDEFIPSVFISGVSETSDVNNTSYIQATVIDLANDGVSPGFVGGVTFYVNGVPIEFVDTLPYRITWKPSNPGTYEIYASARDDDGNKNISGVETSQVYLADSFSKPSVTIIYPDSIQDSFLTTSSTIRLEANATDRDGSVKTVQFFMDGEPISDPIPRVSGSPADQYPYGFTWTPSRTGQFTVYAVAIDNNGSRATSASKPITVTNGDENPPTVSLSPLSDSYPLNTTLFLKADASDFADNGITPGTIEEVRFFVNGGSVDLNATPDTLPPFFSTWMATGRGKYEIYATAKDDDGNIAVSNIETVTIYADTLDDGFTLNEAEAEISGEVVFEEVLDEDEGRRVGTRVTTIKGINTEFASELVPGQKIKFASSKTQDSPRIYTISRVFNNNEFQIEGSLDPKDKLLLTNESGLYIVSVYRSGSVIFFSADKVRNQASLANVGFYVNGTLWQQDDEWPFSFRFVPIVTGD